MYEYPPNQNKTEILFKISSTSGECQAEQIISFCYNIFDSLAKIQARYIFFI